MKEIHAYLNKDGTYRLDGIIEMFDNGQFIDVRLTAARAKITVEVLVDSDSNELYTVTVEDTLTSTSDSVCDNFRQEVCAVGCKLRCMQTKTDIVECQLFKKYLDKVKENDNE
jgi:hypothetical protein